MTWILQLEDQRILRLPTPPPAPPPAPVRGRRAAPLPPPPPASIPDLGVLVKDTEARVRRRAALAIGRVGLPDGIALLMPALADGDAEVRAAAAFALGLIGDASAEGALTPLLADTAPLVRGRAAEALGQIGAKGSAAAIGKVAGEYLRVPAVSGMQPDDEQWPAAPEAEACKLALFALVRLRAYDELASAVLDNGQPVSSWWPVAYALQRIDEPRAVPALRRLLQTPGKYTRAFAARGLGRSKDTASAEQLTALLDAKAAASLEVVVAATRALADMRAAIAARPLSSLAADRTAHPNARLEAVTALGAIGAPEGLAVVQDALTDDWPTMRAAALRAAASIDQDNFIAVLSGLEPDRDWRVRAALAQVLGGLPPELVGDRVESMLQDSDKRVIPSVLGALVQLKAPNAQQAALERLKDPDFVVRAAAARQIKALKPQDGAAALREAYKEALPDAAYDARAAALDGLAAYGAAEAADTLKAALADKDWAVRLLAADLLGKIDASVETRNAIRPAPGTPASAYDDPQLIAPQYSPHVFIETAKGTIEFELAVIDAPQTTRNFAALARKGYFNGLQIHRVVANFVVQDGDPRGDGEGGPGYTIRDELNERPYLRGAVGMALAGRDTGGSQFFIAHSPQPHLDARYTVFGHVVNGLEVLDRIQQGDVIERVRIWDGRGWE
jgi:cyclophilin family peptidyl-prolyl cis-trans isomerase